MQILEDSTYYHEWLQEREDFETDLLFNEWMELYYPEIDIKSLVPLKDTVLLK